ncbi:MAG TPA: hypothetical protein VH088_07465 [Terriglobales bacterium]|jgi:hypothetical protein|nr:hypothetical protein [Terriglobales bacterium]
MRLIAICGVLLTALIFASLAFGQSALIHQQILQTYNFQPHLLSSQEISQKSVVLDQFWSKAKADQSSYLPALRKELANFQNPSFFLYDGSMLLLSLSHESRDRKIVLAALPHCDLRDVQRKDYFEQVHYLATQNEDTTAAAFLILQQPKFQVIIPQHALTLGQDYALIYMLLPTDQNYWLQPAIDRLKVETDATAQQSLLRLLFYAQTQESDATISAFAADNSKPQTARKTAKEYSERKGKIDPASRVKALNVTEASLRQKRRERLRAVSDEALFDLDDFTMQLMAKRH